MSRVAIHKLKAWVSLLLRGFFYIYTNIEKKKNIGDSVVVARLLTVGPTVLQPASLFMVDCCVVR